MRVAIRISDLERLNQPWSTVIPFRFDLQKQYLRYKIRMNDNVGIAIWSNNSSFKIFSVWNPLGMLVLSLEWNVIAFLIKSKLGIISRLNLRTWPRKIFSISDLRAGNFKTWFLLKSVHFKKTVAQYSFLSKVLSFSLKSKQSQQKWQHFWKKWGLRKCLLKIKRTLKTLFF